MYGRLSSETGDRILSAAAERSSRAYSLSVTDEVRLERKAGLNRPFFPARK